MTRKFARLPSFAHWTSIVLPLSAATLVLSATGEQGSVRTWIVLTFLACCPGIVVLRLLGLSLDPLVECGYIIATSMVVAGIAAGVALYGGEWHPNQIVALLGSICLTTAALAAGRRIKTVVAILRETRRRESYSGHPAVERQIVPASPAVDRLGNLRPRLAESDQLLARIEAARDHILTVLEGTPGDASLAKPRNGIEPARGPLRRHRDAS